VNEERARRVNALFGEVLEREPAERATWLAAACSPETRGEVEALLAAHEEMGDFLAQTAPERLVARSLEPGAVVGAYRIVRVIGQGGAGTVYEAEQKSPQRRVALKVRRGGLGSASSLQRFRAEAEILARLQHPDLAHVYEAGVHDGLPFIALELVADAKTVVAYARDLDLAARLRLFARICDAVHHGHVNGIVHRDLKPANLLVLPDGRPKIIDFGIARVEGIGAAPQELVGTPPWMSPEQCVPGGDDVGPQSDVYALGVVLYEMLTGRLPHAVAGLPITEATRVLREQPPAPTGAGVPADLRAVLGKALARDRAARYPSAAALAEEVRRFLAHRPVAARRTPWLHAARLFVRRHRALVAAAGVVFAGLAAAAGVSLAFAWRAAAARDRERFLGYVANLAAADAALRLHDVPEAERRLARTPPDLRHWEWAYLASRLDRSARVLRDPDGALLYAGADPPGDRIVGLGIADGAAILTVWDARTGEPLLRREAAAQASATPCFSPDGSLLAWGTFEGTIEVADGRTLAPVRTLRQGARVHDLAFRADGRVLACASDGAGVGLWDVASGTRLPGVGGREERTYGVRFSPDGRLLAVSVEGHAIEIRDAATGEVRAVLAGHASRPTGVCFTGDGRRLVSWSTDATVRVWDVATGKPVEVLAGHTKAAILCGTVAADGASLLTGHVDGTLTLWDLRARRAQHVFWGHRDELNSAVLLGDGRHALSASRDGTVRTWDLRAPDEPRLGTFRELVRDVAYSRDGRLLAAAAFDGTVRLYDLAEDPPRERVLEGHGHPRVQAVAFRPDGAALASGGGDSTVRLWDCASGACTNVLPLDAGVLSLAWAPRGRWLAAGTKDAALLLPADSGAGVRTLPADAWVWAVAFSPDGRALATTSANGTLRVWEPATGRELHREHLHDGELSCAVFTRDGGTLFVGGESRVYAFDGRTFARTATIELPVRYLQGIAPSPDGSRLAVASVGSLRILALPGGHTVLDLRDYKTFLWDVAWRPDGTQIATATGGYAGESSELRLWGRVGSLPWPPELPGDAR